MCTGAGASSETLAEARESGVDTLIVGEGPHWTAVAAEDYDICVIYAGHYATETLGVQAIAAKVGEAFHVPWSFIHLPTGL
jgi:putative NIF3 family GTP cyclohydrolase 1 type 2